MTEGDLPFSGLRVADLTQGVAGPHCAFLLAQNGADVVKVEPPGGDWGRAIGRRHGSYSAYFLQMNRGKRSLALDLKDSTAREAVRRLTDRADVVLEAFRPGVMARFGLDHASVRARNPDAVYASITGYGQEGPNSGRPTTDSVAQAFTGFMAINRDGDGIPRRIGVIAIDILTGLYAFHAVSAALYGRAVKGNGGRHIDVSLQKSAGAFLAGKMIEYHLEGPEPQVVGAPVGTFETADGHININARRDKHFVQLARLIGRSGLPDDPRFADSEARVANEAALLGILRPAVRRRTTSEWVGALEEADILNAPVFGFGEYLGDEHVRATDSVVWQRHAVVGNVPMHAVPGIAAAPEGSFLATAPDIGSHSREVLGELGYGAGDIGRLVASGTVVAPGGE